MKMDSADKKGMRHRSIRILKRWLIPNCHRSEPQYDPVPLLTSQGSTREALTIPSHPKISVVIPSFNQGRFLGDCLASLISQGYPNLQIILVDGGSNDNSLDVIQSYSEHLFHWSSEADTGQANAINKGMAHADGDILCWLNSDDCLAPNALFEVAYAFCRSPRVDVVYGYRVLINECGQDVGRWILPYHSDTVLTYADFIPQETMFWRREAWGEAGAFVDESLNFAIDWDLIRRFSQNGARFLLLRVFLGHFRLHSDQKTQSAIDVGLKEMDLVRAKFLVKSRHTFFGFYRARLFQFFALCCYLATLNAKWLFYRKKTLGIR